MPTGTRHAPEEVERVRHLVETTSLPFRMIAAETGKAKTTVLRWTKLHGWRRPPQVVRPDLPPAALVAVQRLYEGNGRRIDIALLADRSLRWVADTAAAGGWKRGRHGPAKDQAPAPAARELEDALLKPDISRRDLVRALERATAWAAAAALAGRDPRPQSTAAALARHVATIRNLPEASEPRGSHAENARGMDELRAELTRELRAAVEARRARRRAWLAERDRDRALDERLERSGPSPSGPASR